MQELVRLRQQQQATDNQMQSVVQRFQGMEQKQQQMMVFLAKAVNSPGFLAQFVQQNEAAKLITEGNKKRKQDQVGSNNESPDGQIVKYQPIINDSPNPLLRQSLKLQEPTLVATSPITDGQELGQVTDLMDDAPIDANLVQFNTDNFPTEGDMELNSDLLVDLDFLPEYDQSWVLEPDPEVVLPHEMGSVPMDDYLMKGSEGEPLENASPTGRVQDQGQVQQLTQQMGILSSETKNA
ncbi:heat stress transcription factor A-1b-like [Bidens hawaiensis]|uniref:heat stress transcription factor A-1b-like n=1 Tax=Bidens hawaiensis TaxID=980011 RepID=UPI004048FA4E